MSFEMTMLLLTWVAILLLSFVVAGMVRRVHAMAAGREPDHLGLAPGTPAPKFERFTRDAAVPTVLLFLDGSCGACPAVLDEARAALADSADRGVAIAALFSSQMSGAQEPTGTQDGIRIFTDEAESFDRYHIPVVPFAVLVDQAGRVRTSQPVGSPGSLRTLLDSAAGSTLLAGTQHRKTQY